MQRTRTLERVRTCCANGRSFANMILKKGSSTPSKDTLIMLRMIAIGNFFRISLMYLKKNLEELQEAMEKNPYDVHREHVKVHKAQMKDIIDGFYPPDDPAETQKSDSEIEFKKYESLEDWLGHDLIGKHDRIRISFKYLKKP